MQQWQNKFISSYTIVVYNRFGWTGNKLPWFVIYCSYKIEYLEIVDVRDGNDKIEWFKFMIKIIPSNDVLTITFSFILCYFRQNIGAHI